MSEEKKPSSRSSSADLNAAWLSQHGTLRGAFDYSAFREGWHAAMRSIWDRLPAPDYARDPMTPREVGKLLDYVRSNLHPTTEQRTESRPNT